jgi:ribonuclease Z
MRPIFHPSLVNDPFGDPALYVDCLFEKRALLFDLGDIRALPPRKLLRVSDVFVSHAHMDHFMGFDWLLRVCLGRERQMRLFGPPGFVEQVRSRLAGYTWNLVHNYQTDFTLLAVEVAPDGQRSQGRFRCMTGFRREDVEEDPPGQDDVLLEEDLFRIRYAMLDHETPCLGFALEEKAHVNVWKNRLADLGLLPGAWLVEAKKAALRGQPDQTEVLAEGVRGMVPVSLGRLREEVFRVTSGQKIAYVTDVAFREPNLHRVCELAAGADLLFIESTFLDRDADRALAKSHLTAAQAGRLAHMAGVRHVIPFHFSPLYYDEEDALREELACVFRSEGGT